MKETKTVYVLHYTVYTHNSILCLFFYSVHTKFIYIYVMYYVLCKSQYYVEQERNNWESKRESNVWNTTRGNFVFVLVNVCVMYNVMFRKVNLRDSLSV